MACLRAGMVGEGVAAEGDGRDSEERDMWGCGPKYVGSWSGTTPVIATIVIVALALCLLRAFLPRGRSRGRHADREDSLRILKTRLARGEVSYEEYRRMKEVLEE